jgi:SAM-dependent methyltransferase
MNLKEVQAHWDLFGRTNPLFAILTWPEKVAEPWQADEFFATGERDVAEIMAHSAFLGVPVARGRALDFGCGVGRLTQALAGHFDCCFGVDIAPSMIRLARRYNRHGARCDYVLNRGNDLRQFASGHFDFACALLVLQHLEPRYQKVYLRELLRVLAPGGLLAFQLPAAGETAIRPRGELRRLGRLLGDLFRPFRRRNSGRDLLVPIMEMYATPTAAITQWLHSYGGTLLDKLTPHMLGFDNCFYYVRKMTDG